ncbi:MAG: FMN reductase (NADPH) [Comamonadaceae bacterium]|nr:MAG: FMN reductase (NADPH) [Comamonadaceae bacterium]
MSILLVAGSASERSRSAALLDAVAQRLRGRGATVERLRIRDLSPQALLLGDTDHRSIVAALDSVARATAVVIATPVYKAAYSGVLKVFLDLLPQTGLQHKVVLPIATGGSPNHMLALDYALRPVLQSLAARHILPGVYATDSQVILLPEGTHHLSLDIAQRLDDATGVLLQESGRGVASGASFQPVPFSMVRCSV